MADINGGASDYSTLIAWEADAYGSESPAVANCYGSISHSSEIVINDTSPSAITIQPATGQEHDGTAGSGSIIQGNHNARSIIYFAGSGLPGTSLDRMEVTRTGGSGSQYIMIYINAATDVTVSRNIIHGLLSTSTSSFSSGMYITGSSSTTKIHNNLFYNIKTSGAIVADFKVISVANGTPEVQFNTITDCGITSGSASGDTFGLVNIDLAGCIYRNNLVSNLTNSGSGATNCYFDSSVSTATTAANGADDATSPDSGYSSLTVTFIGSGDYSLDSGSSSNVLTGGSDLGNVDEMVDLTYRDRDTEGDTPSLGSIQYVVAVGGTSTGPQFNPLTGCFAGPFKGPL